MTDQATENFNDLISDSRSGGFDIRDVIKRLETLEGEEELSEDEDEEFRQIESFLEEVEGRGGDEEWRGSWYPVTFIEDSDFESAMDQLVEDCYDIPKNLPDFVTVVLNYDALQSDYTSIEISGNTYWYR